MINEKRLESVSMLLQMQEGIAVECKDGCVLYFQSFSKLPIPEGLEKPEHDLEYFLDYESRWAYKSVYNSKFF